MTQSSAAAAPSAKEGHFPFRLLPSFKLDTLSSLLFKHGELQYQRLFGLRLVECRVLGIVGQYGPVTLRQACIEAGIDKGHGSRLVTRLTQAGWLERHDDPQDQRSFFLVLTAAGRRLQERINAAAMERNRQWLDGLSLQEHELFVAFLDRLTLQAQAMLHAANQCSDRPLPAMPTHERAAPQMDEGRPLLIAPERLRSLHRQLGELLGSMPTHGLSPTVPDALSMAAPAASPAIVKKHAEPRSKRPPLRDAV